MRLWRVPAINPGRRASEELCAGGFAECGGSDGEVVVEVAADLVVPIPICDDARQEADGLDGSCGEDDVVGFECGVSGP